MKIDGVFSGGGIKAYAFVGALKSIDAHNLSFERVAGTSAGSIVASLLAAGYDLEEIEKLLAEIDLKSFLDPPKLTRIIPGIKWVLLYFQMGLYQGDKLEDWIYEKLARKNIFTFGNLPKDYLKVVVSDVSLGRLVVIPDDIEHVYGLQPRDFPVAKAIRMSAGFPYFFMPKNIAGKGKIKSLILDGGLLSNFPMWLFDKDSTKQSRPVLGIKLSESVEYTQPRHIKNSLDLLEALFSTMKQAHDARYISKSEENNIIFIPVKDVNAINFNLSDVDKGKLITLGKKRADQFLKHWPK